jgi:hypothetical protein
MNNLKRKKDMCIGAALPVPPTKVLIDVHSSSSSSVSSSSSNSNDGKDSSEFSFSVDGNKDQRPHTTTLLVTPPDKVNLFTDQALTGEVTSKGGEYAAISTSVPSPLRNPQSDLSLRMEIDVLKKRNEELTENLNTLVSNRSEINLHSLANLQSQLSKKDKILDKMKEEKSEMTIAVTNARSSVQYHRDRHTSLSEYCRRRGMKTMAVSGLDVDEPAESTNETTNNNNNRWSVLQKCRSSLKTLVALMETYASQSGTSVFALQTLSTQVVEAIFMPTLARGESRKAMVKIVKCHLRKTVFSPERILRAMDDHVSLNYTGISILRSLETDKKKYFHGSMLPSTAELQRCAAVVEWYGNTVTPFTIGLASSGTGERISFNPADVLRVCVVANGLESAAKVRPVLIGEAVDGAPLTKNVGVVMFGFKGADRGMKDPITGKVIPVQSPKNVMPATVFVGNETKKSMANEVGPFFKKADLLCRETVTIKHGWKPIELTATMDMSASQKCVGRGGASGNVKFFCHACSKTSQNIAVPNIRYCRWCVQMGHDGKPDSMGRIIKCYHTEMMTASKMEELEEELSLMKEILFSTVEDINDLRHESSLLMDENPGGGGNAESQRNPESIHFDLTQCGNTERREYNRLLTNDLQVRNQDFRSGSIRIRQKRLQNLLVEEWAYLRTSDTVQHAGSGGTAQAKAVYMLLQQPPCILHGECRQSIKLAECVLNEGMNNALEGKSFTTPSEKGEVGHHAFVSAVEAALNSKIFGKDDDLGHYHLPVSKDKKEIGQIKFTNGRARKVIDNIECLIEICVVDDERRITWEKSLVDYRAGMKLLLSHRDLTPEEIFQFQKHADGHTHYWLELYGKYGMTNYFHFWSDGHYTEFLFKWGNLFQHSQQGWEAFNGLLKTFYFRRTQRGGRTGLGTGKKSKLKPVARWLQRRMVWMAQEVTYDEMVEMRQQHFNRSESEDSDDEDLTSLTDQSVVGPDAVSHSDNVDSDDGLDSDDDSEFFF